MRRLSLVHEVLDAQLVDRRDEKIGRVDGLLLELRDGEPPRVTTILVGGAIRAERIGRWMTWLRDLVRRSTGRQTARVSRIPFSATRRFGDCIQLDVDGRELESGHLERWLSERIVCRIPGAAGERK